MSSALRVAPDAGHSSIPAITVEPSASQSMASDALLHYLASVRHGLLFLDPAGRTIACTEPGRRLVASVAPTLHEGSTARAYLRAVQRAARMTRRDLFRRLRGARDGTAEAVFEVAAGPRTLVVDLKRVPGGGWAATLEDISVRRSAEAAAAALASRDPLTGLPNRLMLRDRLDEALARLDRMGEACALLLIDLDRFKPVNDTLGHPVGDALLRTVAERLRSAVRAVDTVARIGGDEFVVLLTNIAAPDDTRTLARRIVDLVGRTYMIDGHLLTIGASVGVALAPTDGTDADRLLKNADLALYRAKTDGRGTFRFFEPEMDARMQARRRLELDLRQALARREFQLHYQPQLNLESNRLTGCEALLRWRHPERGIISPLDFIPLAEEIGLIVPIGEWVVRQACRDAAAWATPISIAVNISPAQFKSERLVEIVMSALANSGLPAHRLEIEITEGVLLQESARTLLILNRLRTLGVRVSMDDFGTGYSSLSYLRSFPFDKIKIDRSFVSDLAVKPGGEAIIRAIAGLGRSLGMTTVAEGVETIDQMQRIRSEGCTDVQGYLISRPVPADELVKLLAQHNPSA